MRLLPSELEASPKKEKKEREVILRKEKQGFNKFKNAKHNLNLHCLLSLTKIVWFWFFDSPKKMPSEDSKLVKKEEEEVEDDDDDKPILHGLKKKLSNANGARGSAKSKPKLKKEESEDEYDDDDDDNKPIGKRSSISKPDKVFKVFTFSFFFGLKFWKMYRLSGYI